MATKRSPSRRRHKPAARADGPITREQIALIHVARKQCQLDEEGYRKLLRDAAGVESSAALSAKGFLAVMARFKQFGFVSKPAGGVAVPRPAPMGSRAGMATDAQIELIGSLWARYSKSNDPRALGRWLERSFGVSDVRFATMQMASLAIEGLKAMVNRAKSARDSAPDAAAGEEPA